LMVATAAWGEGSDAPARALLLCAPGEHGREGEAGGGHVSGYVAMGGGGREGRTP